MTKLQCGNLVEFNSVSSLGLLTRNTGSGSKSTYDMKKTTVVAKANPRGHCRETCHRRGEVLLWRSGLWNFLGAKGREGLARGHKQLFGNSKVYIRPPEACSTTESCTADFSAVDTVFLHQIPPPHGSSRHPEYATRWARWGSCLQPDRMIGPGKWYSRFVHVCPKTQSKLMWCFIFRGQFQKMWTRVFAQMHFRLIFLNYCAHFPHSSLSPNHCMGVVW